MGVDILHGINIYLQEEHVLSEVRNIVPMKDAIKLVVLIEGIQLDEDTRLLFHEPREIIISGDGEAIVFSMGKDAQSKHAFTEFPHPLYKVELAKPDSLQELVGLIREDALATGRGPIKCPDVAARSAALLKESE